jgi:hypothetical protein
MRTPEVRPLPGKADIEGTIKDRNVPNAPFMHQRPSSSISSGSGQVSPARRARRK